MVDVSIQVVKWTADVRHNHGVIPGLQIGFDLSPKDKLCILKEKSQNLQISEESFYVLAKNHRNSE